MISFIKFQDLKKAEGGKEECKNLFDLYYRAFPREERISLFFLKRKAKSAKADFFGVYDGKKFVGLLYCVYDQDIVYIFWFAVNDKVRGGGYGSKILKEFIRQNEGKRIVLNIEDTQVPNKNQKQRDRRRRFYLKNGFKECHYRVVEKKESFEMFYHGRNVTREEYEKLLKRYFGRILFALYYTPVY